MPTPLPHKQRAMRSSVQGGIVGQKPVTLRVVKQFARPGMKILDFGAGKRGRHTIELRKLGLDVTAHDYHAVPGVHDEKALNRKYDLVYSSNVLNVQGSHAHLLNTVHSISKATDPNGMYIANLASGPYYDAFKGLTSRQRVDKVHAVLSSRFGEVTKLRMPNNAHVWICKRPLV